MEKINILAFDETTSKIEQIIKLPTDTDKINGIINTLLDFNQVLKGYATNINTIVSFAEHSSEVVNEFSKIAERFSDFQKDMSESLQLTIEQNENNRKTFEYINTSINAISKSLTAKAQHLEVLDKRLELLNR